MREEELLKFKKRNITDKVITLLEADLHSSMKIVGGRNNKNRLKEFQMAVYCLREDRDRLNYIIDELEKWLEEEINNIKMNYSQINGNYFNMQSVIDNYERFLNKIKKLKEGK